MPDRVPEDMPDRMLEDMPDRMPEGMPDRLPDKMSDRMPEDMPDKVPECLPDRMPEDLPDNMPDRMPDGMPEDMPEHTPEDMPVAKCINVMVGITRSKVFFLWPGIPFWFCRKLPWTNQSESVKECLSWKLCGDSQKLDVLSSFPQHIWHILRWALPHVHVVYSHLEISRPNHGWVWLDTVGIWI